MPDLAFTVEDATVVPFAAAPTLAFQLGVVNSVVGEQIHTAVVQCQLRIEVSRRRYAVEEQTRLRDLFGAPERWGSTMHGLLWTHATAIVPAFTDSTTIELRIPASFDFTVAVTKYLAGLEAGQIPLTFLFSGSIFYQSADGALQVYPVSWQAEAGFALPIATWRELIDAYYPNEAWLTLRRDVFDRLHAFKVARGIPTWEETLEALLAAPEVAEAP